MRGGSGGGLYYKEEDKSSETCSDEKSYKLHISLRAIDVGQSDTVYQITAQIITQFIKSPLK